MVIKYLASAIILLLLSFIVFRVIVRNDYLKKQRLTHVSYLLEVLVFALHAYSISLFIPLKWPYLPPLPESATLRLATLVIIGIGLIILLIAWFGLGTGPSLGLDKNKLKTGGLYRYSRNPQLVGYGLILIAFTLMYLSWYSIGWLIQFLIVSYFMVRSEEEFLTLKYEEEYKNYCKEVPRIIRLH